VWGKSSKGSYGCDGKIVKYSGLPPSVPNSHGGVSGLEGNKGGITWDEFVDCRMCRKVKKIEHFNHHGSYCAFCWRVMTQYSRKFFNKPGAAGYHTYTEVQRGFIENESLRLRQEHLDAVAAGTFTPPMKRAKRSHSKASREEALPPEVGEDVS
jgi:hypothetical protein